MNAIQQNAQTLSSLRKLQRQVEALIKEKGGNVNSNGYCPSHPHPLFDALIGEYELKNDSALARAIKSDPQTISNIRRGFRGAKVSSNLILSIHETFGIPVARIRELIAEQA